MKQKTGTSLLPVILSSKCFKFTIMHDNVQNKINLDSSDDGNSGEGDGPLIVDLEEAVATIPVGIL